MGVRKCETCQEGGQYETMTFHILSYKCCHVGLCNIYDWFRCEGWATQLGIWSRLHHSIIDICLKYGHPLPKTWQGTMGLAWVVGVGRASIIRRMLSLQCFKQYRQPTCFKHEHSLPGDTWRLQQEATIISEVNVVMGRLSRLLYISDWSGQPLN